MFQKKKGDQELMISTPKPEFSTIKIVFLRTFCVLYLLISAILLHMVAMFRPWKQEWVGKPSNLFEISIWKICRKSRKSTKCYEGELDDAPGWFMALRWFIMLSVFMQYISLLFTLAKITFTKNSTSRQFWIPAFLCLFSAIFILCGMLMLVGYREFDFLEESRMYRMGWRFEEVRIDEAWGWPYYLSWGNFAICLVGFLVCMYTHVTDTKWSKSYEMFNMRNKAKKLLR
ncbi:uncharacterized protein [Clytia hemisphaerica]|uniref:Uncharacterized protein n=1 Tax=Clytia hemisphaerica TaxID=252671 RepID=A0A7M5WVI7_9CNID